ncbi:helix-turn-helix domain-containing protein [Kineosporia sp. J2-2]|uniref:Helix-turn-helix domain-containing protein n=1 Tax=Kineosporia corallincola TaxID=2835133 RepID=A0ABS5TG87_9ACTN|nr:helix-turn-helix domain-containing protein [Kineosporia corallincola]MBT0769868.1 helix-turn-helix domain-containing protein [Kineosporia corallincola]
MNERDVPGWKNCDTMSGTTAGTTAVGTSGTQALDTREPGAGFGEMTRRWRDLTGESVPLPAFSAGTRAGLRGRFQATRLSDTLVVDFAADSAFRTAGTPVAGEDVVRLWIVRRGQWALGNSRTDNETTVSAGGFMLRHVGRLTHFATPPRTVAQVFVLPRTLMRERTVTGPAGTAELRLLVAHARMVRRTLSGLGPAGVEAARGTLLELARAVAGRRFDDQEPLLASPLAQAAKDLAAARLSDPDLSAAGLARELRVSLRTLQRAFSAQGESVTGHLREQRLEAARAALLTAAPGWSIADVAAHWQFADASHFSRAFRARYALTPTEYLRQQRELRAR